MIGATDPTLLLHQEGEALVKGEVVLPKIVDAKSRFDQARDDFADRVDSLVRSGVLRLVIGPDVGAAVVELVAFSSAEVIVL